MKDLLVVRKLMVSPQYSCLSIIPATVATHQLYVTVASLLHFLPILFQYSVGVSTFSERSRLAICVGLKPETRIPKICLTTFAADSSTIHSSLLLGFFIYPKGGFGSKRFARHPLALHYPTHLIAAYCDLLPKRKNVQNLPPLYGFETILDVFFRVTKKRRITTTLLSCSEKNIMLRSKIIFYLSTTGNCLHQFPKNMFLRHPLILHNQ